MSAALQKVIASKHGFHFRLWLDRLDLRGDAMNMSDRTLQDIGLLQREIRRPMGPFWIN
jgi:hypothetical protein